MINLVSVILDEWHLQPLTKAIWIEYHLSIISNISFILNYFGSLIFFRMTKLFGSNKLWLLLMEFLFFGTVEVAVVGLLLDFI